MSSRERVLLLLVGGLVLVIGAAIIVPFYLKRLNDVNARVAKSQKGLEEKNRAIAAEEAGLKRTQTLSPRLKAWRSLSLPDVDPRKEDADAHQSKMQIAYQQLLTDALGKSGLREAKITPGKYDSKQTPQFGKDKPIYGVQPFTVEARGSAASVIKFFEGMHKTPLLHQVKAFTLSRPVNTTDRTMKEDDLKVKLTIEVLQVTGAEKRSTILHEFNPTKDPAPPVLAKNMRTYEDMTAKNLFNVYAKKSEPPPPKQEEKKEDPRQREREADVLSQVFLNSIDYTEGIEDRSPAWEATMWNCNRADIDEKTGKSRLDVSRFRMYHAGNRMRVGWDEFRILDKYDNEVLKGAALRIESRGLLVLIDRKVYRVGVGQSLHEAMKTALEEKELKELKIEVPKEPEKTTDKKDPDKKEPDKKDPDKKEPDKKDPSKTEGAKDKEPSKTEDKKDK